MRTRATRNQFRVIGGRWRGRKLSFADRPDLRPTPDRVRETLFNWLQPIVGGARCADLFAGTGALGVEALSRGAAGVAFVEKDRQAAATLGDNLAALGASAGQVVRADAFDWLARCTGALDIVFADPPFRSDSLPRLCTLLAERDLLARGGRLYVEFDRARRFAPPPPWETLKSGTAGQVAYALLGRADAV